MQITQFPLTGQPRAGPPGASLPPACPVGRGGRDSPASGATLARPSSLRYVHFHCHVPFPQELYKQRLFALVHQGRGPSDRWSWARVTPSPSGRCPDAPSGALPAGEEPPAFHARTARWPGRPHGGRGSERRGRAQRAVAGQARPSRRATPPSGKSRGRLAPTRLQGWRSPVPPRTRQPKPVSLRVRSFLAARRGCRCSPTL